VKLVHSEIVFGRKIELFLGSGQAIQHVAFPTRNRREAYGVRVNGGEVRWHKCLIPSLVWKDAINQIKSLRR
jgi:hypothetical protein